MDFNFYEDESTNTRSTFNSLLQKSVSSIDLNCGAQNVTMRKARSFIDSVDGFHLSHHERTSLVDSCITAKETDKDVFTVPQKILIYRGKQYSVSDIAVKWKKDCRMWLWKSKVNKKKTKSLGEMREKLQNVKIHM